MLKLGYSKYAAATPAFALIAEGWNELVQEGLTPDLRADCPVSWTNRVLFAAREDGEIVGALCFHYDEIVNAFTVTLGYVEPTSRRQGVFRQLWDALLARAAAEKITRVFTLAHVNNGVMQDVMKRLGQPIASLGYETIIGG